MEPGFAGRRSEVESALLDYHRAPGQYPLLLRRPPILFASIGDVLQLASGRLPGGAAPPTTAVQRAAGFFIRSALLYPAADHYALLGLGRSADAAAIKERYRQMMRLMHPDFASAAAGGRWPDDAASRVNQAYEVLASDALRRGYDDKLTGAAAPAAPRPAAARPPSQLKSAAGAPGVNPRILLKRMAGAFGLLAAIGLAASWLAAGPDGESLVQRAASGASLVVAAAVPRDAPAASPTISIEPFPSLEALLSTPTSPAAARAAAPEARRAEPRPPAPQRALKEPASPAPISATTRSAYLDPTPPTAAASVPVRVAPALANAAPAPAAANATGAAAPAPSLVQTLPAATASPAATSTRPPPAAARVTLAEAHTLVARLLQQMESGSGERLLSGLEPSARSAPAAQALLRQYNGLIDGARAVKVSNVQLGAEPREDRLLVTGQVLLEVGQSAGTRSKELSLQAEFARRNGTIVMTRLAPGQGLASAGPPTP